MSAALSLYDLNKHIQQILNDELPGTYWVVAEISELNENRSGHCYLELVQKEEQSSKVIAKARAVIWGSTYRLLKAYFESTTGRSFSKGIKVMISVLVQFHELYGFSLNIVDIDPVYTIGDLEHNRQLVIAELQDAGVFEMNKELELPQVPQRIAIISSETAAGYDDFMHHLYNNAYGFTYYTCLFKAYMQGEGAGASIIEAMDRVNQSANLFDVMVIIRGGGSRSDLACFDEFDLAFNICQFPLPVIAGIGHERDISVVDMVAGYRAKTPTAVADIIINQTVNFYNHLLDFGNNIRNYTDLILGDRMVQLNDSIRYLYDSFHWHYQEKIHDLSQNTRELKYISNLKLVNAKAKFENKVIYIRTFSDTVVSGKYKRLDLYINILKNQWRLNFYNSFHMVDVINAKLQTHDIDYILKKGFSITMSQGKVIKSILDIENGESIQTRLRDGILISNVTDKH